MKTPGRPKKIPTSLKDAIPILEAYDKLKVNALTIESVLKHVHGLYVPYNVIHMVPKENARALPQPSKQRRRKLIRYEREHIMSLWYTDRKQLNEGHW